MPQLDVGILNWGVVTAPMVLVDLDSGRTYDIVNERADAPN